ncbi:MAG: hypothetical protein A2328_03985, partial [Bdellovibrionales bacterium RIFOXYB2_FULL_36_6]
NYQLAVFDNEEDYTRYCFWYNKYSEKYKVKTYAFCLMNNHVHFIVEPETEQGLAKLFNTLHMRYSQYINNLRNVKGHLWQGRFYSCILDEKHLYNAIRYVERNPIRIGVVKNAWDYKWSSAKFHVKESKSPILIQESFKMNETEWKKYVQKLDINIENEIRLKTKRGLVVGTENFIKQIENKIKRSLKCLNQGRPYKVE